MSQTLLNGRCVPYLGVKNTIFWRTMTTIPSLHLPTAIPGWYSNTSFNRRIWLVAGLQLQLDGAFCVCCALFASARERKNIGVMVNALFRKWHRKSDFITKHLYKPWFPRGGSQGCRSILQSVDNPRSTIPIITDRRNAANSAENRHILKSVAEFVLHCGRQCIAPHGGYTSSSWQSWELLGRNKNAGQPWWEAIRITWTCQGYGMPRTSHPKPKTRWLMSQATGLYDTRSRLLKRWRTLDSTLSWWMKWPHIMSSSCHCVCPIC